MTSDMPPDTLPGEPDAVIRPTVEVVGRTYFDWKVMRRFVGCRPLVASVPETPAGLVEAAGRLCYDSWDKGRGHDDYIAHLIDQNHLSVLEHAQWTVFVRGVSRTLLAELTRHRHASFSVRSQRYCDESNCRFVVPPDLLDDAAGVAGWLVRCRDGRLAYREMLAYATAAGFTRKAAHGLARSLLPGCAETTLALTGNARTFREVLGKRLGAGAEVEIQRFSGVLLAKLTAESPVLFAGLGDDR